MGQVTWHLQLPPSQLVPLGQPLPQVPQFCWSVWVSTHLPLQSCSLGGQTAPQLPFTHELFRQIAPQLPQLRGSFWRDEQILKPKSLQRTLGGRQAHWPFAQPWPIGQVWPQPPQFRGSVWKSTQERPHWVSGDWHFTAHDPRLQTSPTGQTSPQVPQFLGSDWTLVQVPLHEVCPGSQPHWLFWQTPVLQTIPQPPQLNGSPWVSMQMGRPKHFCSPGGQLPQTPWLHAPPLAQTWPQVPQLL